MHAAAALCDLHFDSRAIIVWESEGGALPLAGATVAPSPAHGCPAFKNDNGVREIRIGVKTFDCVGVSPPHDHPRVYINMGAEMSILCPYCATRFRFDAELGRRGADPQDCIFNSGA